MFFRHFRMTFWVSQNFSKSASLVCRNRRHCLLMCLGNNRVSEDQSFPGQQTKESAALNFSIIFLNEEYVIGPVQSCISCIQ
ncbi:hypothetical protein NPIL_451451 [Nephila pilipes]|uniref:Uncharacterized protein n=1 Tax=Nephila pilipes TaxID=299642 RepID=A0A8X6QNC3_NEPPI|nr:hypothetical protein NPIL_451451 [Nephila pilipes]